MLKNLLAILLVTVLVGCTTTQKAATIGGGSGAVIGGIIGHQSDNDVAGAAIGGVVGTVGGMLIGEGMTRKFCPVGGEQYSSDVSFCPKHGVELKTIDK